jgi:hypothetical protein|tara:strand:+ start:1176 stop:1343 length:168 start_codon:yes stop_codon:yes gene_type:complete
MKLHQISLQDLYLEIYTDDNGDIYSCKLKCSDNNNVSVDGVSFSLDKIYTEEIEE